MHSPTRQGDSDRADFSSINKGAMPLHPIKDEFLQYHSQLRYLSLAKNMDVKSTSRLTSPVLQEWTSDSDSLRKVGD